MRVITEAVLRSELRNNRPDIYYVPADALLTPAGREYLNQLKIKISNKNKTDYDESVQAAPAADSAELSLKFVDYESGGYFAEKPEHMTHLYGNTLVNKDHPRILFRGKVDSLQAVILLSQCEIIESGANKKLAELLQDILDVLRKMMRCDVMGEPFRNEYIIGLNHAQLRERSHNPMKFYGVKQMLKPHYSLGKVYALLNQIRTAARETELAAVRAFKEGSRYTREDIIEELNRISSAVHILMCMYLAGKLGELKNE